MKTVSYLTLVTAVCVVFFWVFMALRPANASWRLIPGHRTTGTDLSETTKNHAGRLPHPNVLGNRADKAPNRHHGENLHGRHCKRKMIYEKAAPSPDRVLPP